MSLSGLKAHSRTSLAFQLRKRKYPHVSAANAPAVLSRGNTLSQAGLSEMLLLDPCSEQAGAGCG